MFLNLTCYCVILIGDIPNIVSTNISYDMLTKCLRLSKQHNLQSILAGKLLLLKASFVFICKAIFSVLSI